MKTTKYFAILALLGISASLTSQAFAAAGSPNAGGAPNAGSSNPSTTGKKTSSESTTKK